MGRVGMRWRGRTCASEPRGGRSPPRCASALGAKVRTCSAMHRGSRASRSTRRSIGRIGRRPTRAGRRASPTAFASRSSCPKRSRTCGACRCGRAAGAVSRRERGARGEAIACFSCSCRRASRMKRASLRRSSTNFVLATMDCSCASRGMRRGSPRTRTQRCAGSRSRASPPIRRSFRRPPARRLGRIRVLPPSRRAAHVLLQLRRRDAARRGRAAAFGAAPGVVHLRQHRHGCRGGQRARSDGALCRIAKCGDREHSEKNAPNAGWRRRSGYCRKPCGAPSPAARCCTRRASPSTAAPRC